MLPLRNLQLYAETRPLVIIAVVIGVFVQHRDNGRGKIKAYQAAEYQIILCQSIIILSQITDYAIVPAICNDIQIMHNAFWIRWIQEHCSRQPVNEEIGIQTAGCGHLKQILDNSDSQIDCCIQLGIASTKSPHITIEKSSDLFDFPDQRYDYDERNNISANQCAEKNFS